jgi:hypothetical protein
MSLRRILSHPPPSCLRKIGGQKMLSIAIFIDIMRTRIEEVCRDGMETK